MQVEISWKGDGLPQADLQQGGVWIALRYLSNPFSEAAGSVELGIKDLPCHFVLLYNFARIKGIGHLIIPHLVLHNIWDLLTILFSNCLYSGSRYVGF